MKKEAVLGFMITLIVVSTLTLAFNIQQVEALPEVVLSDKEIISNPGYTSNIAFTTTVSSPTTTHIWFQIKATLNETGLRFSQCVEDVALEDSTRLTIEWTTDPYDPRFDRLPTIVGTTIYMVDPYWFHDWPTSWVYGITTVYDDWEYALTGYLSEIAPPPPRTIVVPDDYPSIQEAINNANEGDTIFVKSGTYYEHIVVNKTIALVGVNGTIIDASQEPVGMPDPSIARWNGITVLANYSAVTGFAIRNAANFGIEIRADYGVFQNNLVENCNWAGIALYAGVHDSVPYHSPHGNLIHNNTVGLNHMGVWLSDAYNNKVSFNVVELNRWNGIYLSSGAKNNEITNNTVSNSTRTHFNEGGYGIAIGSCSHNNLIVGNNIRNNVAEGIRIEIFGYGVPLPYENSVYHNNFVDNSIQAYDSGTNNIWDNNYPSGGNYWSDYNGTDFFSGPYQNETDSDGIGDTAYFIDENNQDNYPLMNPYKDHMHACIEGTVTDFDTGLPIEGATVSTDGFSDVTDASGSYSLEVSPGTYDVTATMMGYESQTVLDVSVSANETVTQNFALVPSVVVVYWPLTVNSDPSGVEFTVDGAAQTTPYSESLVEGDHDVVMPPTWTIDTTVYNFDHWENASPDPNRTISLTANTTVTAYYVPAPPPERRLSIKLSGDFDYVSKEKIKVKLAALVKDADTKEAVSDANVTIDIYYPNGTLWVSDNMTDRHVGTGIYEWESSDTIYEMGIEDDIYLVHVKASVGDGPVATDMLLFHIDPPSDDSILSSTPLLYYAIAVALITAGTLTGIALLRRYRKLQVAPK